MLMAHSLQFVDPVASWYCPAAHAEHDEEPVEEAKDPVEQEGHEVAPPEL